MVTENQDVPQDSGLCRHGNFAFCEKCESEKVAEMPSRQVLFDALKVDRTVSYPNEDANKILSVRLGDRKYEFERVGDVWSLTSYDEEGKFVDVVMIESVEEVELLEEASKQDLTESLRAALHDRRSVSYKDYGEKKVVSVEHGGNRYEFEQANNEYADWQVTMYDAKGEYVETVDVRETSDVEFLEKLFKEVSDR